MSTKAFAYLRVSGKGQVDGDGFTRQRLAIEQYAKKHDIRIAHWFREEGVSGATELSNRPALQELVGWLDDSTVDVVIVEKLDRLARDLMVQETIIGDLRRRGRTIISVAEPDLCSDDPSRKLVRQVFGAIAEYEKSMLVLKLRGARERKRKMNGRCEGAKPYGEDPKEQATIARIRDLRASGLNLNQIAQQLNDDGVPARRGGMWWGMTVGNVLKREAAQA